MNISRYLPRVHQDLAEATEQLRLYRKSDDRATAAQQLQRLQSIWRDCVKDVPYYAEMVTRGDAPATIRNWDEFREIPVLTRALLQNHPEKFIRRSGPPDLTRMTGGSTGNPIHFGIWRTEDHTLRILKLMLWIRAGYRANSRLFLLWGHSHLLGQGWRRHLRHIQRKGKDFLLGYRRVDAYTLTPGICRRYARALIRYRPVGLIGYASALDYFARSTEEFHDAFRDLGIQFVMPCAEPPPKPDTFELLSTTFGGTVIQEFGGVDFGQVAMQFGDSPFEVFHDHNFLEAHNDAMEQGDDRAVVLTTLYDRYLPLIRYRQGDAIQEPVVMDHGHVTSFKRLSGRINDLFTLPCETQVHSVALFHCVHQEATVRNIQMVLTDSGPHLRLATPHSSLDSAVESRIRYRLSQIAPMLGNIPIECRTDVETTVAGKRRWFIDKRTRQSGDLMKDVRERGSSIDSKAVG